MKSFLGKVARRVRDVRRTKYRLKKQGKLKNHSFSVISNNCVGGVICSDLGVEFASPTINLFMQDDDYFEFLSDLKHYLNCEPVQRQLPEHPYPVGVLEKEGKEIFVYFMHYNSFEEAKAKWIERAKRVNYDNLYVTFEWPGNVAQDPSKYERFKELPFANKRMITYSKGNRDKEIVHCPVYCRHYHPGKILEYRHKFSKKRWLDWFDYVSFFNNM